ncbi:MAG: hypothetical protein HKN70_06565 [Gammaproteobacteria bacterium]|nr:hypothetical protein [Gammaproteobacteria bacterium]
MPCSSKQFYRTGLIVWLLVCVSGCASSKDKPTPLDINSSVPVPLVEKMPVTARVVFSKALNEYVTVETPTRGRSWEIRLGNTNRRVFEDILNSLFDEVLVAEGTDASDNYEAEADFTIVPSVDDYAMLTSGESGSKFYAVSMRHFLDIYRGDGDLAGRLEINSYGRSRAARFTNGSAEIDLATDEAFRDLAVTLIVELPDKLKQAGLISAASPAAADPIESE